MILNSIEQFSLGKKLYNQTCKQVFYNSVIYIEFCVVSKHIRLKTEKKKKKTFSLCFVLIYECLHTSLPMRDLITLR